MEKLDKTDIEIIRNLWDGRTPYSDIAEKVGLTTNTVRNRVNKMLEEGALQIIGLVDPSKIENHSSAYIGFKVLPNKAKTISKEIGQLKEVVGTVRVTGRFDIIATVFFNEEYSFQRFLDEKCAKIEGIVSIETFFAIEGEHHQIRYVL